MGHGTSRGDALQAEGDGGGLHGADPDGEVPLPLPFPEQHDRLVGREFDPDTDEVQLDHEGSRFTVLTDPSTGKWARLFGIGDVESLWIERSWKVRKDVLGVLRHAALAV